MRNWAELLPEMVTLVCEKVDTVKDLVAFGGVCSRWRHTAVEQNNGKPLLPLPYLMLHEDQNSSHRDFFSVTEGKICSYQVPELKGKMCMESKGWIFTLSDKGEMALVHPLTHVQIPLPHRNTSKHCEDGVTPFHFVERVVLSSTPDPKNLRECIVIILHGTSFNIGYCRLGDKTWTVPENDHEGANQSLEYYREKLYVADFGGFVWEYDVSGKPDDNGFVPTRKLKVDFSEDVGGCHAYLVNSAGSLLMVIRDEVYYNDVSSTFWVVEIDVKHGGYKELSSLGTKSIFLGHSATLSVDANLYPGLIPNSIYFTDDSFEIYLLEPDGGGTNMGVYSYAENTVQPHYNGKSLSLICPPVWTFLICH